jgi:hypothetical protein
LVDDGRSSFAGCEAETGEEDGEDSPLKNIKPSADAAITTTNAAEDQRFDFIQTPPDLEDDCL